MPSNSLRSYNLAKLGLILLFSLYVPTAVVGAKLTGARHGEIFPFFNWSLFTQVRNPMIRLEIEITRVGDQNFNPPVSFFELPDIFPRQDIRVLKSARAVLAAELRQSPNAPILREAMESRYLSIDNPVEYQLTIVTFDPLERLRSGQVMDREILSTYLVGGRP